jgi:uncharacterized 2Fe-2S/4Fe-4S cluster protein (DUF4445 family)
MANESENENYSIHFEPGNITVRAKKGGTVLDAALLAGIKINSVCGGTGNCGKCKVLVKKGETESIRTPEITDLEFLRGIRQACQTNIRSDLQIELLAESRSKDTIEPPQNLPIPAVIEQAAIPGQSQPPLQKVFLALPPASAEDNVSDLSRLLRHLAQNNDTAAEIDVESVRHLPQIMRDGNWEITATILSEGKNNGSAELPPRLIRIERGDTRKSNFALAIDVGTTTVKAQLLDTNHRKILAENTEYNSQKVYGADVISRIAYCQKPGGLEILQSAVVSTINNLIDHLMETSRAMREDIAYISLTGNTTMVHLLAGIDPKYIRLSPYTPAVNYLPSFKAHIVGIKVPEYVYLSTFPMVASYIGGDITAGVIAAGMHQSLDTTVYIDIGTNGQTVIGNSEWMVTAACSAGPAFEGGETKHGMIAVNGAIEDCEISSLDLEPIIKVIGNVKPRGICGSGLINIVAELLKTGIIERNGRFDIGLVSERVRSGSDGYEYILALASETEIGHDIVITEIDIANLIRAKAAMYGGFVTLIKGVGIKPGDIERIVISGAFGNYLNIDKAITIGLLPDLPRDKFSFIGNGSLTGARQAAFSTAVMEQSRDIAKKMTNFELSDNSDFMNNYIASLFLPHTNIEEFPSVNNPPEKMRRKEETR